MSAGNRPFSESTIAGAGCVERVKKFATWPSACTPWSVRPAPISFGASPRAPWMADRISPATVRWPCWICQPA